MWVGENKNRRTSKLPSGETLDAFRVHFIVNEIDPQCAQGFFLITGPHTKKFWMH
jgi:hypothetical protein